MKDKIANLMHNPRAGQGRPSKTELLAALRAAGYEPVYHSSEERDFADLVLDDPGDLVVVAGGDGTVGEVVANLPRANVPREGPSRGATVAIVPLGTANNIAHSLGVAGSFAAVMALWGRSAPTAVDVGLVRGPWGETPFLEAAGGGLFPRSLMALAELQRPLPPASPTEELRRDVDDLRAVLLSARPRRWTLALDGEDRSGDYLLFEAMNLPRFGPGLTLAPEADPSDGRFDLVLVGEPQRAPLLAYLDACLAGGRPAPPRLPVHRGRTLEIAWRGGPLHADSEVWTWPPESHGGELGAPVEVVVTLQPGAVAFLLPGADGGIS